MPSNDTDVINQSINQSDPNILQLKWFPNASFSETVSLQMPGGTSQGAFVHFSEANITLDPGGTSDTVADFTTTPWIAFISCDANVTNATSDVDVFTSAKNRGAVAALLYSQWSDACILNAVFVDPAVFTSDIGIYVTKSLIAARTVNNAFTNINEEVFGNFNATMLNQSAGIISEDAANLTGAPEAGYLFAILTFGTINSSVPSPGVDGGNGTSSSSSHREAWIGTVLAFAILVFYSATGAATWVL